jgi:hypothetical protein
MKRAIEDISGWCSRSSSVDIEKIDREKHSIRTVVATENPALVMDWGRWEVIREVLLMSGAELPSNNQVPLLDNHSRYETADIKGSARELKVVGSELVGRAFFATAAKDEWSLVEEGHLTDVSAGYRTFPEFTTAIGPGESAVVNGRTFRNDSADGLTLVIRSKWQLKEVSLTPIGADEAAKFRSATTQKQEFPVSKSQPEPQAGHQSGRREDIPITQTEGARMNEQEKAALEAAHKKEVDEARTEAKRTEQIRCAALAQMFDVPQLTSEKRSELVRTCIDGNKTSEEASVLLVTELRSAGAVQKPSVTPAVSITDDEKDKFHRSAIDGICFRAGLFNNDSKKAADISRSDAPKTLHQIVRRAMIARGDNPSRVIGMDADSLANEAIDMYSRSAFGLAAGDFPGIMLDAANKIVSTMFDTEPTTFEQWCPEADVQDFKTVNMISRSHFSDWAKILDGEAYSMGRLGDKYEKGSVDTYGKGLGLSRKAIVNDDLGMLTDLLGILGSGGRRKLNDLVYDTLASASLSGPTMNEDSQVMFHATTVGGYSRYNLKATSGVVSDASLELAAYMLRKTILPAPDKSSSTRYTGAKIAYIVTGVAKEASVARLLSAPYDIQASSSINPNTRNIWNGIIPVFDPYLQSLLDTASAANTWYAVAGKTTGLSPLKVLYLQGNRSPVLRRAESQVLQAKGIYFDGTFDFGVAANDWRGIVQNDGK